MYPYIKFTTINMQGCNIICCDSQLWANTKHKEQQQKLNLLQCLGRLLQTSEDGAELVWCGLLFRIYCIIVPSCETWM